MSIACSHLHYLPAPLFNYPQMALEMRDTSNKPLVNGSNDSLTDSAIKSMRNLIRLGSLVCLWITIWNAPTLAQNPLGQWSAESPWPTVGVHLAVLADGRVLTWG